MPMKVEAYFKGKMKDKLEFPCTISRKLNGVNGECRRRADESFVQLSRGGEEYPLPKPEVVLELRDLMTRIGVDSMNYEIYKHGEHLQDINGAVKAPYNHTELWSNLEYYVFDLPTLGGTWKERKEALEAIDLTGFKYVRIMTNKEVHSHAEVQLQHDSYVSENYEGSIVRNYKGLYTYNTRTMDVLKVKDVESEEFLIEDYFVDKNQHPVFWCVASGTKFKVKPKGTNEQRTKILEEVDSWLHKWMTVEFEMYSKDGVPLKPVGIGLRAGTVDSNGVFTPTE